MRYRRRRTVPHWLPVAILAAAAGCAEPPPDGDVLVVDASGVERSLVEPARRIVSLVPSATAVLRALGEEDRLVGRTQFDTAEWAAKIASVGRGIDPSLEHVIERDPDLVIFYQGDDSRGIADRLGEFGIPTVSVKTGLMEDVFRQIEIVGAVTGSEDRAAALVADLRNRLGSLRALSEDRKGPSVVYVLGGTPPFVATRGSWVNEIVETAGGKNPLDEDGGFVPISPEVLRFAAPDIVLVNTASDWDPRLAPDARVIELGGRLQVPGPGIAEDAEYLHGLFFPHD